MNERIKEVWIKAASEDSDPDNWDTQEQFIERFAKLIVRECMKESWEEIVADEDIAQEKDPLFREYLTGNNQGIVDAVIRFRNHFGVEE